MTDRTRCPRGRSMEVLNGLLATTTPGECVEWPYALDAAGYGVIRVDGKLNRTHVIACERAHGERPSLGHEVAHSCRNPQCMNPHHLRWVTPTGNAQDRIDHDTWTRGERHGNAKLTDAEVIEIRQAHADGASLGSLARTYDVHRVTIRDIVRGNNWKHLLAA